MRRGVKKTIKQIQTKTATKTTIEQKPKPSVPVAPGVTTVMTIGVITAIAVWGIIEVIKNFFRSWKKEHGFKTPWYWSASLRLLALLLGAGIGGTLVGLDMTGSKSGWAWGATIGIGGGALCTIIVGVVKTLIKAKGDSAKTTAQDEER